MKHLNLLKKNDGSTDAGNVDNELFLLLLFDKEGVDEKVVTHSQLLKVCVPSSGTAESLFQAFTEALKVIGISSISKEDCIKMIGIATDGASSNIAKAGLKGLIENKIPWIFWMWCLAHRLELAIKDALKGSSFDLVDELLLRLYYL